MDSLATGTALDRAPIPSSRPPRPFRSFRGMTDSGSHSRNWFEERPASAMFSDSAPSQGCLFFHRLHARTLEKLATIKWTRWPSSTVVGRNFFDDDRLIIMTASTRSLTKTPWKEGKAGEVTMRSYGWLGRNFATWKSTLTVPSSTLT